MTENNQWSPAFDWQKRIIRTLFTQVSELRAENVKLAKRVAAVEKRQTVNLKHLGDALGVPDYQGEAEP